MVEMPAWLLQRIILEAVVASLSQVNVLERVCRVEVPWQCFTATYLKAFHL